MTPFLSEGEGVEKSLRLFLFCEMFLILGYFLDLTT